jgi:hypothetical protein
MKVAVKDQTGPTPSPQLRRQQILSELVRVNSQITQVQKELASLEQRLTTGAQAQGRAA